MNISRVFRVNLNAGPTHKYYGTTTKGSTKWKTVVGLEVHAQIQTNSKLFSGSATQFSNSVNSNVSLFDMAIPGTLPVLNKKCVEAGILTALSLNCNISPISYFDRKHYFYADLPSGYQITQQRAPIATKGLLNFHVFTPGIHKTPLIRTARIKQLQLEQDSGRSLHDCDRSLVDLNRAGMPLMELVFEPDLADGEEAAALVRELKSILERLQTCSCKMEEGALRVDANVSINKEGEPLGTRTEIKNIGSIKGVAGAIKYEIHRQVKVRENGGIITNETRSWNPETKTTVPMRDKEVQQDYRYMPEPNLPPLYIAMGPVTLGCVNADLIKQSIPELPQQTRERIMKDFGLTVEQSIILVNDDDLLKVFEEAIRNRSINYKKLANFLINEFYTLLNEIDLEVKDIRFDSVYLGEIQELLEANFISRHTANMVVKELLNGNCDAPRKIVVDKGWQQITGKEELQLICQQVMDKNPKAVKDYLKGKEKAFKALLGAVYKDTNGLANMQMCDNIFKQLLAEKKSNK